MGSSVIPAGRTPEVLGATATQAQGTAIRCGSAHGIDELLALSVHGQGW